jgi:hypothetical protein
MPNDAESRLRDFVAKFSPEHQRLIRAARKVLRHRFAGAFELVYDNYNFFVIGYSPTERPSEAIVSLVGGTTGIAICFLHGAKLPDPERLLTGGGKQTRFLRLESATDLVRPAVETLIATAIARAKPLQPGAGRLVIRSVSAKQRPRRRPE